MMRRAFYSSDIQNVCSQERSEPHIDEDRVNAGGGNTACRGLQLERAQ